MSSSLSLKKNHWTDFLRHCAICNSSFPPIQWLCSYCLKKLESYYIPSTYIVRLESSFKHFRLIDWTEENDQFIRKLLLSLKGPKGSIFFKFLAREFFFRIQHQLNSSPCILVPCPPHSSSYFLTSFLGIQNFCFNKKDHSYYWGKALSEWTGYPIKTYLKRNFDSTSQKRKKLLERKKIIFNQDPSKTLPLNTNFIFTDDVLTSGATAKSIHLALGKPKPFWVWSLFWRKYKHDNY